MKSKDNNLPSFFSKFSNSITKFQVKKILSFPLTLIPILPIIQELRHPLDKGPRRISGGCYEDLVEYYRKKNKKDLIRNE
jgi:hypothetical protein